MTKRRLYAQLTALVGCLAAGTLRAAAQPQGPCGACVVITIPSAAALPPDRELNGLTVLVRVTGRPDPSLAPSIAEIARRGGRGGIALEAVEAGIASIDRAAFDLKQALTEYRAVAGSAAVIALSASNGLRRALQERGLDPYVDAYLHEAPSGDLSAALEMTARVGEPVAVRVGAEPTLIAAAVRAASLFPRSLTRVAAGAAECDGQRSELFLHPLTLEHVALLRCSADVEIRVSPPLSILERIDLPGGATIVRVSRAAGDRFAEDVQVRVGRRLRVDEVIARHQAASRRQATLVSRVISSGSLTVTFEAPGFPAPVTVSSATVIYVDRDRTELEHHTVRINGIAFRGGGVPRLPILEPERVASLPLTISLTDGYRYRLENEDVVEGVRCYVVSFEPLRDGAFFRGRAWIAADGFALMKVSAVQTGLRGAIVSSQQVDEFRQVETDVWLLVRSDVRQVYEGAGHRTPIHRRLILDRHFVNPADFEARRSAAYASSSVMLRDTPHGYRYLRREGGGEPSGRARIEVAQADSRVRTVAAGVIIDPNISRPLPFAGLSYVNFDLFGTGAQLNGFFGGVYGHLAFSVPSFLKSRWQLSGRGFAIASSYNDRSFRAGREVYDEAFRQRPAHAALWLLRPLTPRISVRAGYDLDYTRLRSAPETSPDFVVPADQVVHGARFAIEGQRAGWSGSLWWNPARRAGWRKWGKGDEYHPRHRAFQRFGAALAKSTTVSPRVVTRVEAQWMGGIDLDRFSRYAFGTFDNRLRGYPSALVRYDRGGVLRGTLAWSAAEFIRVDGFVDTAAVHDPGFGRGLRNYTGVGVAAEAPAPFGLLAAVEWGYGFRGIKTSGDRGTHVVRVSAFKVF